MINYPNFSAENKSTIKTLACLKFNSFATVHFPIYCLFFGTISCS